MTTCASLSVYPQRRVPQRVRTLIDFLVDEMRTQETA